MSAADAIRAREEARRPKPVVEPKPAKAKSKVVEVEPIEEKPDTSNEGDEWQS
jgi:hypothetical protein